MENTAIHNEISYLRHAVDELSFLNELALAIGTSYNSEEIMKTIISKSIRAVKAEQGAVILVNPEADKKMKTLVRSVVASGDIAPFSLNEGLLGWMYNNKKPLSLIDPSNDPRFAGMKFEEAKKSIACVPLLVKSNLIGILSVYNKKGANKFSDDDMRLLTIIASQSAQIIENARLYEEEKNHMKLKEEARMAHDIQINLLPKSDPDLEGYDIAGRTVPASSVGGDYYDFISLDSKKTVICLGDISGKGMPAALLMSYLQAAIRGQVLYGGTPKEYIKKSNTLLFRNTDDDRYATFFLGILNIITNEFKYTNAGHNPPLFVKSTGSHRNLSSGGPVIGFIEDLDYIEEKFTLVSGDIIVLYTDGVTEAMNESEEEFGEERLHGLLLELRELPADKIINGVIDSVNKHSQNAPQSDDITMIVVKKL